MSDYIRANIKNANTITANVSSQGSISADLTIIPSATTTQKGIIRIATAEEAIEGISNNAAITPNTLRLISNFVFEQAIAKDTWIIEHNLNKYPSVTVVDSANNVVIGSIEYIDENNIIINFNGAFKGKAYLN